MPQAGRKRGHLERTAESVDPGLFEGWKEGYCPVCGSRAGMDEVGVCRKCSRYIKTRDSRKGNADVPLEAEDLATIHLDLLAGKEGFERGK